MHIKYCQCKPLNSTLKLLIFKCYHFSRVYLSSLVVLSVVGSTNHMLFGRDCNRFLQLFSVQINWNRLTTMGKQTMTCLQGLRLFSIIWVILGHCYGWISFQIFRRSFAASGIVSSFWFQPVMHGSLAVDTFFMIRSCIATDLTNVNINSIQRLFSTSRINNSIQLNQEFQYINIHIASHLPISSSRSPHSKCDIPEPSFWFGTHMARDYRSGGSELPKELVD